MAFGPKLKDRSGKSIGTRFCNQCKKDILLKDFHKDKSRHDGLTHNCRFCRNAARKARYHKNGANWKRRPYAGPGANKKLRQEILDHYGTSCACCGESTYEFLCIDHTEGGGNQQRREHLKSKGGNLQLRWLKKNNFPPGFRVLCYNCNNAMAFHKVCPHQIGKLVLPVTASRIAATPGEIEIKNSPDKSAAYGIVNSNHPLAPRSTVNVLPLVTSTAEP